MTFEREGTLKINSVWYFHKVCCTSTVPCQRGTWTHLKLTVPVPNRSGSMPRWTTLRCGPEHAKANCTVPGCVAPTDGVQSVPNRYLILVGRPRFGTLSTKFLNTRRRATLARYAVERDDMLQYGSHPKAQTYICRHRLYDSISESHHTLGDLALCNHQ